MWWRFEVRTITSRGLRVSATQFQAMQRSPQAISADPQVATVCLPQAPMGMACSVAASMGYTVQAEPLVAPECSVQEQHTESLARRRQITEAACRDRTLAQVAVQGYMGIARTMEVTASMALVQLSALAFTRLASRARVYTRLPQARIPAPSSQIAT